MNFSEPSFTFGIEEEYLLIDLGTRDLAIDPRPEMMEECHSALGNSVGPEFLRSQIEVATGVCHDPGDARTQLADLRGTVERVVGRFDCALIAASTHPFGRWQDQKHTAAARYSQIAEDLRLVAQRLLTCGMHVHVAIEDPELRIDLMNQAVYFLPHLLALSTSSPFWDGADSGLMSYRLSVLDELPRSGLPDPFQSAGEYDRTVASLVSAGLIEDASKLWWDVRPSARFPTLEMRVTDVCTRLEDALCLAALFRCLCRLLYRLRRNNQSWRIHSRLLVNENRWRAQRYGSDRGLEARPKSGVWRASAGGGWVTKFGGGGADEPNHSAACGLCKAVHAAPGRIAPQNGTVRVILSHQGPQYLHQRVHRAGARHTAARNRLATVAASATCSATLAMPKYFACRIPS